MPIEIKELNIKVNVVDDQNAGNGTSNGQDQEWRARLIAECVEQVLEILSKNKER